MALVFERGGEKLEPLRVKREFFLTYPPSRLLTPKNNATTLENTSINSHPIFAGNCWQGLENLRAINRRATSHSPCVIVREKEQAFLEG